MAYISSFVYCDDIQTDFTPTGPVSRIVKPLQVLAPIAVPSNYSFAISYNIEGFDADKENTVQVQFVSPDGKVLQDTGTVKFQVPPEQIGVGRQGSMQFNLDMRNIILDKVGLYATKILLDGKEIGKYSIEVNDGSVEKNSTLQL